MLQHLMGEWLPPRVIATEIFVNFLKYVVLSTRSTHFRSGVKNPLPYSYSSYSAYLAAFSLSSLTCFLSSWRHPSLRYWVIGVIQVSTGTTQLTVTHGSAGNMLGVWRNSTRMTFKSSELLVDARRARASACTFWSLGICWILNKLKALSKSLAFSR